MGMDDCPQKNQEKEEGEQRPANYFAGFFQIRRLDWLMYKKHAGSASLKLKTQGLKLFIREY
jgi:hypothetical protein